MDFFVFADVILRVVRALAIRFVFIYLIYDIIPFKYLP